jgi:hypothetical protein
MQTLLQNHKGDIYSPEPDVKQKDWTENRLYPNSEREVVGAQTVVLRRGNSRKSLGIYEKARGPCEEIVCISLLHTGLFRQRAGSERIDRQAPSRFWTDVRTLAGY